MGPSSHIPMAQRLQLPPRARRSASPCPAYHERRPRTLGRSHSRPSTPSIEGTPATTDAQSSTFILAPVMAAEGPVMQRAACGIRRRLPGFAHRPPADIAMEEATYVNGDYPVDGITWTVGLRTTKLSRPKQRRLPRMPSKWFRGVGSPSVGVCSA